MFLLNSLTLFALFVLFVRSLWSLSTNVTTIESWEIERHEVLIRRARARGGYLDGPNGVKVRIKKQEFPYDIGIFANIRQGMGGGFLTWLWPFARSLSFSEGLTFDVNGFEGMSRLSLCVGEADVDCRSGYCLATSRPRSYDETRRIRLFRSRFHAPSRRCFGS